MNLKFFSKFVLGFSILATLSLYPHTSTAEKKPLGSKDHPLQMMFVPSGDSQMILKEGNSIASQLSKITGLHFSTGVATSYAAVVEAMGAGKVDIGWLATFSYVMAKQKYDVDLLLIVSRFGSPFYRGQIVVGSKSGIKSLKDLKGKRFAFVDPASTSGHIYPKTLFLSEGHNPDKFFSKTVFAGSHNAVILSVLKGEVDAGATYDDARAAIAKSFPDIFKKTRVIAYTEDIPNDTVSVRKDLSPELKAKVKNGLLKLAKTEQGSRVLKKLYGISGLMDLDAFFDPVRKAGRLLNLEFMNTP